MCFKRQSGPCVIAQPTEQVLGTVAGCEPDTAIRVRVEPGMAGHVRLEQLAYNGELGWYTQKSFCIPAEAMQTLLPLLKQANCLLPASPNAATPGAAAHPAARPFDGTPLKFVPPIEDAPAQPRRREA